MRSATPAVIPLLTLCFAASAGSQLTDRSPRQESAPNAQFAAPPNHLWADECPVRFSAQRYGLSGTLLQTDAGSRSQYAQSMKIVLDRNVARTIARIAGRVHGTSGSLQVLPGLLGTPKLSEDRSEAFEFRGTETGLGSTQYLSTMAIPIITRIEITEIDWTNGSRWRPSRTAWCSVAPSLFVLVDAAAQ